MIPAPAVTRSQLRPQTLQWEQAMPTMPCPNQPTESMRIIQWLFEMAAFWPSELDTQLVHHDKDFGFHFK